MECILKPRQKRPNWVISGLYMYKQKKGTDTIYIITTRVVVIEFIATNHSHKVNFVRKNELKYSSDLHSILPVS